MTDALTADLVAALSPDRVRTGAVELGLYGRDASVLAGEAAVACFPLDGDEVAAAVRIARRHGRPFVARGSGTGLAGGAVPVGGPVVIVTTKMDRILEVDPVERVAWVQPGVINLDLTRALAPHGLHFAPDPSSQQACTIGGNVANNSGGPHTLKYGVTTNHVLGLEVVLPDGEVVWLGGKTRDPQGYDLVGVFVGSEGTFGIATKIVVRILRRPPAVKTLLAVFDQLDQASGTVAAITARGLTPAALEMIDHITIQAVEDAYGAGYPRDAAAALLIELDGLAVGLDEEAERVVAACRENGARDVRVARDEAERLLLWKGRKSAFGAYGRISPAYFVMDGVIPRTRLPEVLRRIDAIVGGYGLRVGNVFHAGDGNLHPNILYDPRNPGEVERVLAAGAEIMKVCVEVGGSISGEHGIGIEKQNFMPWIFSEKDLQAMAAVKAAFNPTGRCNPGKVFPTAKSCVPGELAYRPHPLEERGLAQRL